MPGISIAEIMKLSIPERILLVEDVWDSIAAVPEAVPLTDADREELDRRIEQFRKNPTGGSPWDEVKARLQAAKHRQSN